jgi:hypothetical protein
MRAATADHGQTIHELPRNESADSTQLPDEPAIADRTAAASTSRDPNAIPPDLARVIGNVAKA